MRLITRTQRFTMLRLDRGREQIDKLHAKNDHLRKKLGRTFGRRLLRLVRRRRTRARQRAAGSGMDADAERLGDEI
jgi:hypothetical protein